MFALLKLIVKAIYGIVKLNLELQVHLLPHYDGNHVGFQYYSLGWNPMEPKPKSIDQEFKMTVHGPYMGTESKIMENLIHKDKLHFLMIHVAFV